MLFKVEGEMDKISVEEDGFCNCLSVPGGAHFDILDLINEHLYFVLGHL